jgi:hypothetical protein
MKDLRGASAPLFLWEIKGKLILRAIDRRLKPLLHEQSPPSRTKKLWGYLSGIWYQVRFNSDMDNCQ